MGVSKIHSNLICIYTVASRNSVSRNSGISRYSGQKLDDRLFIK